MSSRARITPTHFVNTYERGDLRGDPRALMASYFDAFLYLANWGTRQLMLRLPSFLLDLEVVGRYCTTDTASAWSVGDSVIVSLTSEKEDDGWEEGAEESLSSIVPVRSELGVGDRRLLRGWAALEADGSLRGHIYFHLGDDSGFSAIRAAMGKR